MYTLKSKSHNRRTDEFEICKEAHKETNRFKRLFRDNRNCALWKSADQEKETFPNNTNENLDFCTDALQIYYPFASAHILESIDIDTLDDDQLSKFYLLQCLTYTYINNEKSPLDCVKLADYIQSLENVEYQNRIDKAVLNFIFLFYQICKSTSHMPFNIGNSIYKQIHEEYKTILYIYNRGYDSSVLYDANIYCGCLLNIVDLIAGKNNDLDLSLISSGMVARIEIFGERLLHFASLLIPSPVSYAKALSIFESISETNSRLIETDFDEKDFHIQIFKRLEKGLNEKHCNQGSAYQLLLFDKTKLSSKNTIAGPDITILSAYCNK